MARRKHGFLQDEQGDYSLARVLLVVTVAQTWLAIWLVLFKVLTPPVDVLGTLADVVVVMLVSFAAWAGGPKIARYILTQLGQVVTAMASRSGATVAVSAGSAVPNEPATESNPGPDQGEGG